MQNLAPAAARAGVPVALVADVEALPQAPQTEALGIM